MIVQLRKWDTDSSSEMIPIFFFCFDPEMIPFFSPPLVSARPSSLSFPVAFTMAAAINVPLGRAFVKKKIKNNNNNFNKIKNN